MKVLNQMKYEQHLARQKLKEASLQLKKVELLSFGAMDDRDKHIDLSH